MSFWLIKAFGALSYLIFLESFTGKERAALSIIDDIGNKSTVLSS